MPRKITLRLTEDDRRLLRKIAQKDENWRVRERAQTVLYFDESRSAEEVAELMGLHVRTVSSTRTAWLAKGVESLRTCHGWGRRKSWSRTSRARWWSGRGSNPAVRETCRTDWRVKAGRMCI